MLKKSGQTVVTKTYYTYGNGSYAGLLGFKYGMRGIGDILNVESCHMYSIHTYTMNSTHSQNLAIGSHDVLSSATLTTFFGATVKKHGGSLRLPRCHVAANQSHLKNTPILQQHGFMQSLELTVSAQNLYRILQIEFAEFYIRKV